MVVLLIQRQWLKARQDEHDVAEPLVQVLTVGIALLGAHLVTTETLDFFRKAELLHVRTVLGASLDFACPLALAAVWLLYSLVLTGYSVWKKSSPIAVFTLIVAGAAVITAGGAGLQFEPIRGFVLFANLRAVVMILAICVMFIQRWLFAKRHIGDEWGSALPTIYDLVICVLGFELATVETLDFFRRGALVYPPASGLDLFLLTCKTLALVWMAYSLLLASVGLRKKLNHVLSLGLASVGLGTLFSAAAAVIYGSGRFAPVMNYRAGVLLPTALVLVIHYLWLRRARHVEWSKTAASAAVTTAAIIGAEFIAFAVADACVSASANPTKLVLGVDRNLAQSMMLAAAWAIYSIPLIWYGLRARLQPIVVVSMGLMLMAVLTAAIAGSDYAPMESFTPVANPRFAAMAIVAAALLAHHALLARKRTRRWVPSSLTVYRVVASLLAFELLTLETWHYYEHMALLTPSLANHIADKRQLALSVVWVLYSIILMSIGIWRRTLSVRVVAIILFYLTIAKLFLSDLSFLDTLYRAISFIAVAPILLATSYLYQHYRSFIFGTDKDAGEDEGTLTE
jgi:uncharacterized membrane protein